MKIAIVQLHPIKGDIERNIEKHINWIKQAINHHTDMIVFPELSLTGYEPGLAEELATDQNDSRLDDFQKISDLNNIVIGVGLPIKSESGILISMVIFQPNLQRQTYSKQQLHSDEKRYFTEGNKQIIVTIKDIKIAPAICYESLQIEHLQKAIGLGAELYLTSVAKSQSGVKKAFIHFQKIASKYSIPVLMSNSIGFCDNFESVGQTSIWDEKGILKGQLDNQSEGILVYDTVSKLIN